MLPLVLLVTTAAAAAMQTRETVQRVVLLRTTGSDLQPAATGFIYNKHGDGPESLVRMRESDVMEHLTKLYAPSAAGRVIPVQEDNLDGVADVDYEQIFRDYRSNYGDGRHYGDYLQDLKRFQGGLHHRYGAEDDSGGGNHRYGTENTGSYNNAKFESYSVSRAHNKDHDDGDARKEHHRGSEDEHDAARGKDDARGFRGVHDDIHGNDYEHKAFTDEHDNYHGAGGRGHKYFGYGPEHHHATVGNGASAEEQRDSDPAEGHATSADTGPEGTVEGNSYGYKVEH